MQRKFRTAGHVFGATWKIMLAISLLCDYPLHLMQLIIAMIVLGSGLLSLFKAMANAMLILDDDTKNNPKARSFVTYIINFINSGF